jgi:hypothetical protein
MKIISLIVLIMLFLALTVPAFAHDPFIEEEDWGSFDQPKQVADSSISYALYGYLDEEDVDVFQLDFAEAEALLRAEVLTPVCGEHYANFYPQFAILTAKENVAEPLAVSLPFEIPDELAVWYSTLPTEASAETTPEPTPETRSTFVEPFGGTEFYDGPSIDLMTPAAGSYYVVVFNADGLTGDYTLATGYKEQFNSPADQMLQNVQAIRSGEWLHRRCDLPPGDPEAVIEHEHEH